MKLKYNDAVRVDDTRAVVIPIHKAECLNKS